MTKDFFIPFEFLSFFVHKNIWEFFFLARIPQNTIRDHNYNYPGSSGNDGYKGTSKRVIKIQKLIDLKDLSNTLKRNDRKEKHLINNAI